MERPMVAVTMGPGLGPAGPRAQLNAAYVTALESANVVPVLVAPHLTIDSSQAILRASSGLLLTGGADIDPRRYGEAPDGTEMDAVSPARDTQEIALFRAALDMDLPVLAICRGMQLANVALAGSLVQDIASGVKGALPHRQAGDRVAATHEVTVEPGTILASVVGGSVATNSLHHQAIARLGSRVLVTGRTADGVIEAIEVSGQRWVVGVQWHPEEMAAHDRQASSLFAAFGRACRDAMAAAGHIPERPPSRRSDPFNTGIE